MEDKVRENRLRRQAGRLGLVLRKSRARRVHLDDLGKYMLVDAEGNYVVAGGRFDLDLDALQEELNQREAALIRTER